MKRIDTTSTYLSIIALLSTGNIDCRNTTYTEVKQVEEVVIREEEQEIVYYESSEWDITDIVYKDEFVQNITIEQAESLIVQFGAPYIKRSQDKSVVIGIHRLESPLENLLGFWFHAYEGEYLNDVSSVLSNLSQKVDFTEIIASVNELVQSNDFQMVGFQLYSAFTNIQSVIFQERFKIASLLEKCRYGKGFDFYGDTAEYIRLFSSKRKERNEIVRIYFDLLASEEGQTYIRNHPWLSSYDNSTLSSNASINLSTTSSNLSTEALNRVLNDPMFRHHVTGSSAVFYELQSIVLYRTIVDILRSDQLLDPEILITMTESEIEGYATSLAVEVGRIYEGHFQQVTGLSVTVEEFLPVYWIVMKDVDTMVVSVSKSVLENRK